MAEQIEDGLGSGRRAKVDRNNALLTQTIMETGDAEASNNGDAYNINTGDIAYTGTGDSSLIYLKNNEDRDLHIDAIAVGVGLLTATITDSVRVTLINGPTGGDLISDATAVDMNQNRNLGSTRTLEALAYKGKNGGTVTGGNDIGQFYLSSQSRLYAPIKLVLPKGSSAALKVDLNTSGGGNVYAAFVCHIAPLR